MKLISEDIYNKLKEQRVATGTDYLKDNNMEGMRSIEAPMLNNKHFIADKLRLMACIQIDYGNFKPARQLLLNAIKIAPFFAKNYRSLRYYYKASRAKYNANAQLKLA